MTAKTVTAINLIILVSIYKYTHSLKNVLVKKFDTQI